VFSAKLSPHVKENSKTSNNNQITEKKMASHEHLSLSRIPFQPGDHHVLNWSQLNLALPGPIPPVFQCFSFIAPPGKGKSRQG